MTGNAPKRKGSVFERELVHAARDAGLEAERAWGSDGRSMGCAPGVDLTVQGCRIQAKRRARVASWLLAPDGADAVAVRADRGPALVVLTYTDFLRLLKGGW